ALGRTSKLWDELVSHLSTEFDPLSVEWGFSGKQWGWSARLKHKKRTIVYLTPCERHFLAGFALGEKAVKAAHECGLPKSALECIDSAPKYAEGRGVRFEVRTKKDLEAVKQVAAIKMAN
ncbi:MAG: DUF3788 domain-containing protein, partial [Planctomycetes bacterium]|nr:DUF3788 domain-containing protein [Planctomycetota bacterium]